MATYGIDSLKIGSNTYDLQPKYLASPNDNSLASIDWTGQITSTSWLAGWDSSTYSYPTIRAISPANLASVLYSSLDGRYVNTSGDTMTGALTIGNSSYGWIFYTDASMACCVKTDGGWSRGTYMYNVSTSGTKTLNGGLGWYGAGATCHYCWIGTGYEAPWFYVTPAGYAYATRVYGAVWNDYAEFRTYKDSDEIPYGRVVVENGDDTLSLSTQRLQKGGNICSDTFGFAIGETKNTKMPIAVSGRVLVYTNEERTSYEPGDAVCTGPNGTVSKMTHEEIKEYPDRIIGYVSAIPNYETWGDNNIKVDGRIWIKVK